MGVAGWSRKHWGCSAQAGRCRGCGWLVWCELTGVPYCTSEWRAGPCQLALLLPPLVPAHRPSVHTPAPGCSHGSMKQQAAPASSTRDQALGELPSAQREVRGSRQPTSGRPSSSTSLGSKSSASMRRRLTYDTACRHRAFCGGCARVTRAAQGLLKGAWCEWGTHGLHLCPSELSPAGWCRTKASGGGALQA